MKWQQDRNEPEDIFMLVFFSKFSDAGPPDIPPSPPSVCPPTFKVVLTPWYKHVFVSTAVLGLNAVISPIKMQNIYFTESVKIGLFLQTLLRHKAD